MYTHTDFSICALHCYWLQYMRNQRIFIRKSEELLSWMAISLLFWWFISHLVTTQILICGNQTTWTLEILIRTTVAALFKTKYNGRFVQNKRHQETGERNFSQWCKWSWKMRVTKILRLEQYLVPDYAHPFHPLPHKQSHANKKDTVCPMTSAYPTSSPHNPFSNSHHDERASFLITQLPKK